MKTWHRILVVAVLLGIVAFVGFKRFARDHRNNLLSVSNLRTIGLAWSMYADDNNDKLPDLSGPQSMKQALIPYLSKDESKGERFFVTPRIGIPYQPNSSLSYKERKGPNASADIAVVYEAEPAADGTRGVLFGDCHVERVNKSRWQELKKTSNIL